MVPTVATGVVAPLPAAVTAETSIQTNHRGPHTWRFSAECRKVKCVYAPRIEIGVLVPWRAAALGAGRLGKIVDIYVNSSYY